MIMVPMRDGIRLSTAVIRPRAGDRLPTIFIRTPYLKEQELLGQRELIGPAPLAGTESRLLGVGIGSVKLHVLRPRQTGGARGTAVDTGCPDRIKECAVRSRVTGYNGWPARIVHRFGRKRLAVC